jgi:hypothetical protein
VTDAKGVIFKNETKLSEKGAADPGLVRGLQINNCVITEK